MAFTTMDLNTAAREMEARTGRPMEQWVTLVHREGPVSRRDRLDWLMGEYRLERSEAEAVLVEVEKVDAVRFDDADDLISELFSGTAAGSRPLFDRLAAVLRAFGKDVTAHRSRDSILFTRNWPFAAAKPVEDGLLAGAALPVGVDPGERMRRTDGSEGFPKRVTHTVFLGIMEDLPGEVVRLFREAYETS